MRITGRRGQAVDDLQQSLAIARATGMAFMGPVILGMLALAAEDLGLREGSLSEGEALLASNGLAHNHLLFRRDAIDACLETGDRAGALRHAMALRAFTCTEPLPWSDFLVDRACLLATPDSPVARSEQAEKLRRQGEALGLLVALPAIDAALAAG
jgi:hypothetical protein